MKYIIITFYNVIFSRLNIFAFIPFCIICYIEMTRYDLVILGIRLQMQNEKKNCSTIIVAKHSNKVIFLVLISLYENHLSGDKLLFLKMTKKKQSEWTFLFLIYLLPC